MSSLKAADQFVRASTVRRIAAFILAVWTAAIISNAVIAAHRDGLDPYTLTYLSLTVVGIPSAIGLAIYAYSLGNSTIRRAIAVTVGLFLIGAVLVVVMQHRDEEKRIAEHAQLVQERKAAKQIQDKSDLSNYGPQCHDSCAKAYNPNQNCVKRCAIERGDSERRLKWEKERATCDEQCAADTAPMCDVTCEIAKDLDR